MKWDIEETILLIDLYYKTETISLLEKNTLIRNLSQFLNQRKRGIITNLPNTFRNVTGITMQLYNIQFLVTNGERGLSSYSALQKEMMELYKINFNTFCRRLKVIMEKYNLDETYRVKPQVMVKRKTIFIEQDVLDIFKKYMVESKDVSELLAAKLIGLFQEISTYAFKTRKSKKKLTEIRDVCEFKKTAKFLISDKYIKNSFKSYDRNVIRDCFCFYSSFIAEMLIKAYSADDDESAAETWRSTVNNAESLALIEPMTNTMHTFKNMENDFLNWMLHKIMLSERSALNYINAIKRIEVFARNNEIVNFSFFDTISSSEVAEVIDKLKIDKRYVSLNQKQHNLFSVALNNFYKFMINKGNGMTGVINKVESIEAQIHAPGANGDNNENTTLIADFTDKEKTYTFTKPTKLIISGKVVLVKSWADLYIKLCNAFIKVEPDRMYDLAIGIPLVPNATRVYFNLDGRHLAAGKKLFNGTWAETNFSAKDIVNLCDLIIKRLDYSTNIIIEYFIRRNSRFTTTDRSPSMDGNEHRNSLIDDKIEQQLLSVISEYFKSGFKLNSIIDAKKFCHFYKGKYGVEIQFDVEVLSKILGDICIKYENQRIMSPDNVVDEATLYEMIDYILKYFEEGKQAIYYEGVYSKFKDRLLNTNVYSAKVLKELLAFYLGDKYNFQRSYMTVSATVNIDIPAEVEALLKANDTPMPFENIAEELSHITEAKLQQILRSVNFVEADDNCYTHISMYDISENELNAIKTYIQELLENAKFITTRKLFSVLSETRTEFLELHAITNATCLKNVLTYYMGREFDFKWNFIGKIGEEMSVSGMIRNYSESRNTFTLNDLVTLGNEIDINVTKGAYIEDILHDYIRLDGEAFAKPNLLHFDVQATDKAIGKFCINGYNSLSSIDRFGIFPSVGIAWNSYLLESYVNHFSEQFEIMSYSLSVKKSIGAVVDKAAGFMNYDEVLADLAYKNDHLDLQNEEIVIQYFYNNGYIAQRRLKPYIGNILSIARRKKLEKRM